MHHIQTPLNINIAETFIFTLSVSRIYLFPLSIHLASLLPCVRSSHTRNVKWWVANKFEWKLNDIQFTWNHNSMLLSFSTATVLIVHPHRTIFMFRFVLVCVCVRVFSLASEMLKSVISSRWHKIACEVMQWFVEFSKAAGKLIGVLLWLNLTSCFRAL